MATTYTPSKTLGDVLLIEVQPGWTKGAGTITAGNHPIGTVLAKVSNKYQPVDFAGSAAAKKAVAVLGEAINASSESTARVVIERGAVVAANELVWPSTATDAQKATALDDLAAVGIIAREQI